MCGYRPGLAGALAGRTPKPRKRIEPEYDKTTGKLQLLKYDSNGNGKVDTWSYMDGARVVRIEIDKDEDGKIDRWEYYGADQKLEKIGSRARTTARKTPGRIAGPDGAIDAHRGVDAAATARSIAHRALRARTCWSRAEEDSDGDGKMDKWETYDGDRLASVAFDTTHRGTPDRRLIYGADGTRAPRSRSPNGTRPVRRA